MRSFLKYGAGFAGLLITVGCVSMVLVNGKKTEPVPVAVSAPDLKNDVSLRRECATLFREIITIQDDRETLRRNLNKTQKAFHSGETTENDFAEARVAWLESENSLATQAAAKYSTGRSKGCFQKIEQ